MKIGLVSLGCPKNLVDSEVMLGLARDAGHEVTADPADADVLVVNTCAFIDKAKQESIDTILEMAQHKAGGTGRRLVVTGCLAERYRDELKQEIPEIDVVLGTGEVPEIVAAIGPAPQQPTKDFIAPLTFFSGGGAPPPPRTDALRRSSGRAERESKHADAFASDSHVLGSACVAASLDSARDALSPVEGQARTSLTAGGAQTRESGARHADRERPTYLYDADTPRHLATPRHYAYVKIAEGCDYTCAFCIIPTLRGAYRSRPAASIVAEARALAARGVKELLLISQDSTFYGIDRQERGALGRLLRELNQIDGLAWIRLLYLYPTTIDDATLEAMAECDKVCRYVDLPLQHASNRVLTRMKRPGTRQSYERLLDRIRTRVPGVALRTTFIVGFPGETDADVETLCEFVEAQQFDHVGVFTYSHEEGTTAFALDDDVPAATKAARRRRVMTRQRRLAGRRQRALVGTRARVVIDGPSGDHELVLKARLATQAPDIDACVYMTECDPSQLSGGDLVDVEIVGAKGYDLIARPASVS